MPMVNSVTVVEPEHSSIVLLADEMIGVCQIVFRNPAVNRHPNFFAQLRTAPWTTENRSFVDDFLGCLLSEELLFHQLNCTADRT